MFDGQIVDRKVNRKKFEREVELFRKTELLNRQRGIILVRAAFPEVLLYFCAAKLRPRAIIAATRIGFENYDLQAPSVRFVDPFTTEPVLAKDLGFQMLRLPQVAGADLDARRSMVTQGVQMSNFIQFNGPDDLPFLCLAGVREYHDNPAHTGDSWLLHKGSGVGSLAFIAEKIWAYGTNPIESFMLQMANPAEGVQMQMQMRTLGVAPALSAIPG